MNENNQGDKSMGAMNTCGCKHGHALKWLVKILILVAVFCLAFEMGEMKGMLMSSYGGRNMMYRGGMMMNGGDNSGWGNAMPMSGAAASGTTATPAQ